MLIARAEIVGWPTATSMSSSRSACSHAPWTQHQWRVCATRFCGQDDNPLPTVSSLATAKVEAAAAATAAAAQTFLRPHYMQIHTASMMMWCCFRRATAAQHTSRRRCSRGSRTQSRSGPTPPGLASATWTRFPSFRASSRSYRPPSLKAGRPPRHRRSYTRARSWPRASTAPRVASAAAAPTHAIGGTHSRCNRAPLLLAVRALGSSRWRTARRIIIISSSTHGDRARRRR